MTPRLIGLAVVLVAAAWMRFPPLLNANDMNSDGAIVGVQAIELQSGNFAGHLYGSGYQTSVEPMLARALFALGGPSPLKVALIPYFGMLAMLTLAYFALTRQLSPASAVLCLLPLVIGSIATNMPMMYVMRQTMITCVVAGVAVLHGAAEGRWPLARYGAGVLLAGLSVSVDTFALSLGPALAVFAVLCVFDASPEWKTVLLRGAACAVGGAAAAVAARAVGHLASGAGGLSTSHVARNWPLFESTTFPFALNWKVWRWNHVPPVYNALWDVPEGVRTAQMLAAFLLLALMASAFVLIFVRRLPWETRRLGLAGALGAATAPAVYLCSGFPSDQWSARYLAPLLWLAPFALAPIAKLLRPRGLAVLLAPWLIGAVPAAWLTWGPYVEGVLPAYTDRGRADDERVLRDALRAKGVEAVSANYWLAYRLSLLFELKPVVVPHTASDDRIPAHRATFNTAKTVALVDHPSEQRSMSAPWVQAEASRGARITEETVAGFRVWFVERP